MKKLLNSKMTKKLEKYQKKINNAQKDILKIKEHFNKSKAEQKKYLSQIRNLFKRGYYSPTTLKFHEDRLDKYKTKYSKHQSLRQLHAGGSRKSAGGRRRKY